MIEKIISFFIWNASLVIVSWFFIMVIWNYLTMGISISTCLMTFQWVFFFFLGYRVGGMNLSWKKQSLKEFKFVYALSLYKEKYVCDHGFLFTASDKSETHSGNYVISFGKHAGTKIEDLPESYLVWIIQRKDILESHPELHCCLEAMLRELESKFLF